MQTLLTIAAIAAALYLAALIALYVFQRSLIYYPDPTRYTPAQAGLSGVREVVIETQDGEHILAWWAPASPGRPTFLYFHGNAGGLITRADRIKRFAGAGLGVFMPAYRGYAGSSGKPSEAAIVADALLAYDYLRKAGIAPDDIIAYGESLGSGVAVQLAAARPVSALILDAPYTSLPDIGKHLYPFAPVATFMVDRFEFEKTYRQGESADPDPSRDERHDDSHRTRAKSLRRCAGAEGDGRHSGRRPFGHLSFRRVYPSQRVHRYPTGRIRVPGYAPAAGFDGASGSYKFQFDPI